MITPLPFLLFFVRLLLFFSEVSMLPQVVSKPDAAAKPVIPDPAVMRKMKEYKTEVIKSRILNEMNLPEPPIITTPVHIPPQLLNRLIEKEVKDFSPGLEENLIAYPLNDNTTCRNETSCERYEFELSLGGKSMSSMHVWVQKAIKSMPIEVTVCLSTSSLEEEEAEEEDEDEEQDCKYEEKLFEVKNEKGWSTFELPYRSFMGLRSESLFCAVEISGTTSHILGDEKPFIVANLDPAASERKRRSTTNDANKNCTCCLLDFYVSFKEMDWNFVIAPSGFNAGLCYGICDRKLSSYNSSYHITLETFFRATSNENEENLWTPCCSPVKLKPLNMLYLNSNETITNSSIAYTHQIFQDMIIEKCGCW